MGRGVANGKLCTDYEPEDSIWREQGENKAKTTKMEAGICDVLYTLCRELSVGSLPQLLLRWIREKAWIDATG